MLALLRARRAASTPVRLTAAVTVVTAVTGGLLVGCSRQQPVTMAPPVAPAAQVGGPYDPNGPGGPGGPGGYGGQAPASNGVFDWTAVPVGQQVPIAQASFDQSGYQLVAQSGETIVIPFANQNLYVLRFGRTGGNMYFVNENGVPTLYVPQGGYLINAVAQGARWYPFPQNYAYTGPVYLGIAPTWTDFVGMGWYPGMSYYGGYWSYHPWVGYHSVFTPMVGLYFNIGGHPYYGWNSYRNYYRYNPSTSVRMRTVYNTYNSAQRTTSPTAFGRSRITGGVAGGTGSFGRRSYGTSGTTGSFGRSSGTGSFGSAGSTGSFSGNRFPSGNSSFPSGPRGSFGSSGSSGYTSGGRRSSGSFGSGTSSGYGGSFGSGRSSGSSFGSGSSSFGRSSSGSGFGSGRSSFGSSSGGSFGSGRSSFGSGRSSFGGGRSSFGGGFGRRR